MARILICEDDERFRRLLRKVLGAVEGFHVEGDVGSAEQALALLDRVDAPAVDLLLLDLELPGMSGIELLGALGQREHPAEVLVLTSFADEDRVFEAMRLGAAGYLVKGLAPARLEAAAREVLAGGTVIEARLARRFWNYFAAARGRSAPPPALTERELEVLTLVGRGLSNPEAARVMRTSRRAVKGHLERIYRKLGVRSRVEATVAALRAGLIEL